MVNILHTLIRRKLLRDRANYAHLHRASSTYLLDHNLVKAPLQYCIMTM